MPSDSSIQNVSPNPSRSQSAMDALIGYILLYGVLLSLALICAALIWKWANSHTLWFDYELGGKNLFALVADEFAQAFRGQLRPRVLLSLGVAVLMLTPFVRVLASVFYFFFLQKNWKYTLFTLFVLAVLTYSLFIR